MTEAPLQGVGVLVTRPRAQAAELIKAIEEKGGAAICFPVIEISPRNNDAIRADLAGLPKPDIAIFVSSNAVAHGLEYTQADVVAAIGPATVAAIESAGAGVDIAPLNGFDSESLLAEDGLQNVAGKNVLIIRGEVGRELLANTLRERGATVDYLSVYARVLPEIGLESLRRLQSAWQNGEVNAITVMSVATLDNLIKALPESLANQIPSIPLVTPAVRVIKEAHNRYPGSSPVLASGTSAAEMVDAIIANHLSNPGPSS